MSYRDSRGRFAKAPAPKMARNHPCGQAAPAPAPRFNAEANAKALLRAVGNGDFVTVKGKLSAFVNKVEATTPLEKVIVAMIREYCGQ